MHGTGIKWKDGKQPVNNQTIMNMLQGHFSSKGLELNKTSLKDGLTSFKSKTGFVAAYIMEPQAYSNRNELFGLMLKAASNTAEYNQTYLVLPKLLGPMMDAKHLDVNGLGLILYDDRGLYEALPAKYFVQKIQNNNQLEDKQSLRLASEIDELRREIADLKKNFLALKTELNGLNDKRIVEKAVEPLTPSSHPVHENGLPVFLKDNPWITVLSKRGSDRVERQ